MDDLTHPKFEAPPLFQDPPQLAVHLAHLKPMCRLPWYPPSQICQFSLHLPPLVNALTSHDQIDLLLPPLRGGAQNQLPQLLPPPLLKPDFLAPPISLPPSLTDQPPRRVDHLLRRIDPNDPVKERDESERGQTGPGTEIEERGWEMGLGRRGTGTVVGEEVGVERWRVRTGTEVEVSSAPFEDGVGEERTGVKRSRRER